MKKITYFISALLLINLTGCNDILDQDPHNEISGNKMWTTESQADQGMTGIYYCLRNPMLSNQIVGAGGIQIGYYAFEALGMSGQSSYAMNNLYTTGVNPGVDNFKSMWKWCYDGVFTANDAITYIPNIAMDANKKARYLAEAKTLRAYFYTRLNELYGNNGLGVPLYTEPRIDKDQTTKSQSSEADIWVQIIKDLTEAIDEPNLPNINKGKEGRITKGAAYALRGKAYLLSKEYGKAAIDFGKVKDCGYGLYPNYAEIFTVSQENCNEIILSVQNISTVGYGSALQKYVAPFQAGSKDGRGCWTDLQIAPAVVDLYEVVVDNNTVKPFNWSDYFEAWDKTSLNDRKVYFLRDSLVSGTPIFSTISAAVRTQINSLSSQNIKDIYLPEGNEKRILAAYTNRDPRLAYNIITPYSEFVGVNSNSSAAATYVSRWPAPAKAYADQANAESVLRPGMLSTLTANKQSAFYYMQRKFVGTGLEYDLRENNPIDEPIIRYADVLLMWAEALVESGDLNGAMNKVKEVRERVGMPTMSANFASPNIARDYVRDERRREFVGEGVNFFDEMRWRTLKDTKFKASYPQVVWGESAGGTIYQWVGDQMYTWPVPKDEVERNLQLKKTPGWTY